MEEYSTISLCSKDGVGANINNLTYPLTYLRDMSKVADVGIAFWSFHLNDIVFNVVDGSNKIDMEERKNGGDPEVSVLPLTAGFYTPQEFALELEDHMNEETMKGIQYLVSIDNEGKLVIVNVNKSSDHTTAFLFGTGVSVLAGEAIEGVKLGFTNEDTLSQANFTSLFSVAVRQEKRIRCYTNLIKSINYESCSKTTSNLLFASYTTGTEQKVTDFSDFYNFDVVYFPASTTINRSSFYVKFLDEDTRKPFVFRSGLSYSLHLAVRTRKKVITGSLRQEALLGTITLKDVRALAKQIAKLEREKENSKGVKGARKTLKK